MTSKEHAQMQDQQSVRTGLNREYRQQHRERKAENARQALNELTSRGLSYQSFNKGYHIRVRNHDFYPTTGLFKHCKTGTKGRGVKNLIESIAADSGAATITYHFCTTCKQRFPLQDYEQRDNCLACIKKYNIEQPEPETIEMQPDWQTECDCCGQVPTIKGMDMCAACTFGEASAQEELRGM